MKIKTTEELNNYVVTHNSKYHLRSKWVSVESINAWAVAFPHDTFEEFLEKLGDDSK